MLSWRWLFHSKNLNPSCSSWSEFMKIYIAQWVYGSSNTGCSSIPLANSVINWQWTLRQRKEEKVKRNASTSLEKTTSNQPKYIGNMCLRRHFCKIILHLYILPHIQGEMSSEWCQKPVKFNPKLMNINLAMIYYIGCCRIAQVTYVPTTLKQT